MSTSILILNKSQVTTEVGYCRAWIRLALNEGLLSSYLAAIRRDNSALKPYYNRAAFIRDTDLVEVAQRILESIDHLRFELACNSSLLNFWSSTPLLMAAIWSPPMKSCPVFSAVDIAKTISCERPSTDSDDEIETASSIGSLGSFTSSSQVNLSTGLSEDEALRIILAKKPARGRPTFLAVSPLVEKPIQDNGKPEEFRQSPAGAEMLAEEVHSDDVEEEAAAAAAAAAAKTAAGNSLIGKLGWSTDGLSSMTSSAISRNSEPGNGQTPVEGPTYDALLKSYHNGSFESPNLEELLEKYPPSEPLVVAADVAADVDEPCERRTFDEQLGRVAREKGLDSQNYNCLECGQAIGLHFAKANVCHFSGSYFCCGCMASEECMIPARVVHNWDLRRYPVSVTAVKYLAECTTLLDLKILNPRIYNAVDCMAQLQTLRVQLNLLRAYLFTCREPIIESLQKRVAPREYLYEHVHQYAVADLPDIPNGTLAQQLQKVVEFARGHVLNCWLCSQKGFICEVCSNPKVIYPFDTQTTYRVSIVGEGDGYAFLCTKSATDATDKTCWIL